MTTFGEVEPQISQLQTKDGLLPGARSTPELATLLEPYHSHANCVRWASVLVGKQRQLLACNEADQDRGSK